MALIRGLHGRLKRGDILLADAYYSSFDEVVTLAGMGVDVVMRRHGGRPVDFRRGTRLGREDHMVEWRRNRNRPGWMGREEFAALPRVLAMRELRVRVDKPGFRTRSFVVVTTLLDPAAFPAGELASLYRRRWHGELDIRSLKVAMRMDVLRCKTPAMVRKEFWAHLLAYDLIRGAMAEAARRHGVLAARVELPGGPADAGGVPGRVGPGHDGSAAAALVEAALVGDRVASGGGPAGPGGAAGGQASAQGVSSDAGAAEGRPKAFDASRLKPASAPFV